MDAGLCDQSELDAAFSNIPSTLYLVTKRIFLGPMLSFADFVKNKTDRIQTLLKLID